MNASKYPLAWPDGWDRTPSYRRRRAPYKVGNTRAIDHLMKQLKLMGGHQIVLSTNIELRNDGLPYANQPKRLTEDPGAAVYWSTSAFKDRVIACDKWQDVYDNIHALGLAIEHMRGIDRSGASQIMTKAFSAFGALPAAAAAPVVRPWWELFGFPQALVEHLTFEMVKAKYRELAVQAHPDRNSGNNAPMVELNQALERAKEHFSQ